MSKIAKVAKVLGPAGVMPNPKSGTVTQKVKEAVKQIKKGKVEIRTEPEAPIIHTVIGKKSFKTEELEKNFLEIISLLKQNKPTKAGPFWIKTCFITSTMSPSAQIDVTTL